MEFTEQIQGFGIMLKQQIDNSRKTIKESVLSIEQKNMLNEQLNDIETAITNPEHGGMESILKKIELLNKQMNDTNTKS